MSVVIKVKSEAQAVFSWLAKWIELKANGLAQKRPNGVWNIAVVSNGGEPSDEHHFVSPFALGFPEYEFKIFLIAAACAELQYQGLKRGPWLAAQK